MSGFCSICLVIFIWWCLFQTQVMIANIRSLTRVRRAAGKTRMGILRTRATIRPLLAKFFFSLDCWLFWMFIEFIYFRRAAEKTRMGIPRTRISHKKWVKEFLLWS
jgi:hypothetical protein